MKHYLLIIIMLLSFSYSAKCQDNTNIRINFETKDNQHIQLYEIKYMGDVNTSGYSSWTGTFHQHGRLTKNVFLLNAPKIGSFKKDTLYELMMEFRDSYNFNFTVETGSSNQHWMLTPAGEKYKKSHKLMLTGLYGLLVSGVSFGVVALSNKHANNVYKMDLDYYNTASGIGGLSQSLVPPKKPQNLGLWYLIPGAAMSVSLVLTVRGKSLYNKNKPMAVRIE